jgi:GNAT superfamily N-acetyltransferase
MTEEPAIRKVETKADFNTFLTFPWTLYKDDPCWVPPMVSMQRHKFDRQKNSSWQHMTGEFFIAWRGAQPVGTIAAFVNHRHNEFHEENIGFFGAFEVYDDPEAARALLATAADYVRAQGCDAIRGPATFSTNDECGILIEGFDDPPVVLCAYNPAYYQRLIESAPGFEKAMDLYSWRLTLQSAAQSDKAQRLYKVIDKNNKRRGITVRLPDTKHLKQEFTTLKDIYNSAWEENWGFVPMSDQELDELVADLGTYFEPILTIFAEVDGEPAGFLLGVPDMFQALHRAYPRPGKPEIITMLQALWHWKIRSKITRVRIPLLGVKEQYRGIGVEAAMFADLYARAVQFGPERGWEYADGGWVLETNDAMNQLCEKNNGHVYKRFRFYERDLTSHATT